MRTDLKRKLGSLLVSLLLAVGQYVPLFSILTPNYALAVVDAVTPSTNNINRTNGWAHADATPGIGEVVFNFIQPRYFVACFEYRTDGDTSQMTSPTNYNSGITDGLYRYFCLDNRGNTSAMTRVETISANSYVEVRMVFGGETDERFDWTRFDVLPPDITPPAVPIGIHIIQGGQDLGCENYTTQRRVTIDWDDNGEEDFDHYDYRIREGTIIDHPIVSEKTGDIRDEDGYYKYSVRAVDVAGNESEWSEWCGITLDRVAPSAPEIVSPDPEQWLKSQPIRNDWTGVVDDLSGLDYYRIEYAYDDGHTFSGFPYRTTPNSWRNHVPGIGEQGGVSFRVQAFDNAGNEGAWSEWRHYFYDATAPTVPSIIFLLNNGFYTTAGLPKVDWIDSADALSPTIDYRYQAFSNAEYTSLIFDSPWRYPDWLDISEIPTPGTPQGVYYLRVLARDVAGNLSAWSNGSGNPFKVTVDNTPPVVELTSPTGTLLSDTVAIQGSVNDVNPHHYWLVIDGLSASQVGATSGVNYDVVNDSSSFTNKLFFNWNTTMVPDGTYTIKLEARDAANNKSGKPGVSYAWLTVTIDNTAPVVTWNSPQDKDVLSGGSFALDASADDLSLVSYFVLGEDGTTLTPITSPWDPQLGFYTLAAQATDLAGNKGEAWIDVEVAAAVSGETVVGVTTTLFTATWTTDKPTTSRVVYDIVSRPVLGDAPNYGYDFSTDTFNTDPKVTSHSVTVTGLTPGTLYYFRTVSSGSPTTVGDEQKITTGAVLAAETTRSEVLGVVLPATGVSLAGLGGAALALTLGILLRRRAKRLSSLR